MEKFFYQVVVVLYQEQLYGQYIKDVGLHGAVSLVPWEIEFPWNPGLTNSTVRAIIIMKNNPYINKKINIIIAGIVEFINRGFAFFLD